jgi:hypothetical protein
MAPSPWGLEHNQEIGRKVPFGLIIFDQARGRPLIRHAQRRYRPSGCRLFGCDLHQLSIAETLIRSLLGPVM